MIQAPIKRSKNLVQLSKDHHEGLLVVWKIRQGDKLEIDSKRIANFVVFAFEQHLEPHFLEEEQLLFSKMRVDDELLLKATEQHAVLRQMVAEIRASIEPSMNQLEAFASLLEEHIRFEERMLFPAMEKQFSAEILNEIGASLELHHSKQQPLVWQDQFWIRK